MNRFTSLCIIAVLLAAGCSDSGAVGQGGDSADVPGGGNNDGLGNDGWPDGIRPGDLKTTDNGGPEPGQFGAPCQSNSDCDSGFCVEGPTGFICTQVCVEDCPAGYKCVGTSVGADVIFICMPIMERDCEACTSDLQCGGGRCVPFGPKKFCLANCADGSACKEGYQCQNTLVAGKGYDLCVPNSATCECVAASLGQEKSCKLKTGANICYGVQFCTENGWGDCLLPDEICDGKDNDCNEIVDDGMLNLATGRYESDEHCGVCNNSCKAMAASHAHGSCSLAGPLPTCAWECEAGYHDVNVNPTDGCECKYAGEADDPDEPGDANCDGIDGVIEDGVFVAKNGNDDNLGTLELPLLTIQEGIQAAFDAALPNVYVATGVYEESISLLPGVKVYGGYSADFEIRDPDLEQTALLGFPFSQALPGTVNAFDVQDIPTLLSGFHVYGGDAVDEGGSSYAILARNSNSALRFVNNRIIAGNGRDGTHAADGKDGDDGADGGAGAAAKFITSDSCSNGNWSGGGGGGQKSCDGEGVSGGDGGTSVCPDYDESGSQPKSSPYDQNHKPEEWGKNGSGSGSGSGGEPGFDSMIWEAENACTICSVPKKPDGSFLQGKGADGKSGQTGADGTAGNGCGNGAGQVVDGLWTQGQGSGGGKGKPGAGGGGGGAGGGVETIGCKGNPQWEYTDIGGSGGGAGSGGCAGDGAEGGKSGGGSFAVFIAAQDGATSVPVLKDNLIQTGFGGDGGDGGSGGTGGEGGAGNSGGNDGSGNSWCADAGGHGGSGGRGGHGGGGGGGCGGPSFAIYLHAANPALGQDWLSQNQFALIGAAGSAGSGGKSMGQNGSDGQNGASGQANF